jgi:hypothetical protein
MFNPEYFTREQYPALFEVVDYIAMTCGDDYPMFTLPDLTGQFIQRQDTSNANQPRRSHTSNTHHS